MKICLFGIPEIKVGKHNVKDPRLDAADRLVEAKKKTYGQVDVVDGEGLQEAEVIVARREHVPDLILRDLEFVETRLGRNPPAAEQVVLEKLKHLLEHEKTLFTAGLTEADFQAVAAHSFTTNKPIVAVGEEEIAQPETLMVRAVAQGGYISFLTVGGKENRAWLIRQGTTAWEAAAAIHSDIQKGFIRAEIISYQDFIAAGGETEAKRAGKQRLELKTYVLQDCDLVNFRFNK